jgi:hypothetical protein
LRDADDAIILASIPSCYPRCPMVRMQIQFTDSEVEALRHEATQHHMSISAVVREAVDERLTRRRTGSTAAERRERAIAACGRFHSGLGDLAARHDHYFAESVDE